jgi:hypothetical protein
MTDHDLEEAIEHAVAKALLEKEQKGGFGRRDWFQMAGLLVMLLLQTVYVTSQWGELRAGIQSNKALIEVKTEDRYTRTEAEGDLELLTHRLSSVEDRGVALERLSAVTLEKLNSLEQALIRLEATLVGGKVK